MWWWYSDMLMKRRSMTLWWRKLRWRFDDENVFLKRTCVIAFLLTLTIWSILLRHSVTNLSFTLIFLVILIFLFWRMFFFEREIKDTFENFCKVLRFEEFHGCRAWHPGLSVWSMTCSGSSLLSPFLLTPHTHIYKTWIFFCWKFWKFERLN